MTDNRITETEARLNSHEAVCAVRYEQINARLKRLESILMTASGVLITSTVAILWSLLVIK
jgi:hypothetical protein